MKFVHRDSLKFPFEERGLQFGDGVYEVIRIYKGRYYLLNEHVDRLFRSAVAIKIDLSFTKAECRELLLELLSRNKMDVDGQVYLQITRGCSQRDHVVRSEITGNLYAYLENVLRSLENLTTGLGTIAREDVRSDLCYLKSLNLLPNVLAKQEEKQDVRYEAILHK